MATKKITQQTFDDVVKENMEDFDMTIEDAIEDAVKQFESQGVDLSNIVRDPRLFKAGEGDSGSGMAGVHPVVEALQHLDDCLKAAEPNQPEVLTLLKTVQTECDVDLARRCLAGSNNAYPILKVAMTKFKGKPEVLGPVLLTLCSLVNGQPDVLDESGCDDLMALMADYQDDATMSELLIRAIGRFLVKHEMNRQMTVEKLLINKLSTLMSTHRNSPKIVKEICMCFRALTQDDDPRVPFGKAYDHARMIVTEGDALKMILSICHEYTNNQEVLGELFATLARLAVRNEFCQEVMELGGLQLIIDAFKNSLKDKVIAKQAMTVMGALAGNDRVKAEIVRLGGVAAILSAMNQHQSNAAISEAACATLAVVALRNPSNCQAIMEQQGHVGIVQAMKIHPDHENVQKQACMALRNLVSREKSFQAPILETGVEELLNRAMVRHKSCVDEAKAALRDLGCQVELKEQWKGKMGTIPH